MRMRTALIGAAAAALTLAAGCTSYGSPYSDPYGRYTAYDYNRPDPRYGGYYPERYYRQAPDYYVVRRDDRVYRGRDGRLYCRRSDGTTGLVVGGAVGGTLGAIIAPGGSEVLGALIGGAAGAALGQSVDRGEVRCR
jgi:Glycine zipper 2TM domain